LSLTRSRLRSLASLDVRALQTAVGCLATFVGDGWSFPVVAAETRQPDAGMRNVRDEKPSAFQAAYRDVRGARSSWSSAQPL
jgi:hypothetical protein